MSDIGAFITRLRTSKSHYEGTAIAPLLDRAARSVEDFVAENERLRGLLMAAQDVLGGIVVLSGNEHDLFMELLTQAIDGRVADHPLYALEAHP